MGARIATTAPHASRRGGEYYELSQDVVDMSDQPRPAAPSGNPAIRTLAMPANTNPNGDIFGGWLMSQMDIAGGSVAVARAHGRTATVAVDAMTFHKPVFVGDVVSVYADLKR